MSCPPSACVAAALSSTRLTGCTADNGVALAKPKEQAMSSVFELELQADGRAFLTNTSGSTQWVLHDTWLQPSRLVIQLDDGSEVQAYDTRSAMKYDNTVYRSSFEALSPGERKALFRIEVRRGRDGPALLWGPFEYSGLARGRYRMHVVWDSELNRYYDEATQTVETLPDVALGTFRSPAIDYELR